MIHALMKHKMMKSSPFYLPRINRSMLRQRFSLEIERFVLLMSLTFVALFLTSGQARADEIDFARDIAPIFEQRCSHCHGEFEQESGLRLDRRVGLLRGGDSGSAAVVPGDPSKSYLLDVVKHLDPGMEMPPDDDPLPEEEIELLTRWIREGAMWPGQMDDVVEEHTDHWSFQPIARSPVPVLEDSSLEDSPDNPIDVFLRDKLRSEGLNYSPPASPLALNRRLSIVLTGLPPTSEEADAFVLAYHKDPEAAYVDRVDHLLASQHFGERWAQHWLDVIRWAETNGSESNMYRKNAWLYRDYVINAFNEDKPYNQFLFEQIAGDTVGQGDATGYLVAGPHVPVATVGQEPSARRQARADRMDEILQTIGASAMGVTIGCARCHNHKFDPISIQDYYSMSAVFQDVEFGSRFPELKPDHPRRVRGKELDAEIAKLRRRLQAIGPWEENWIGYKQFQFLSVVAENVRITFDRKSVRLDEIEIRGPENPNINLALAELGTTVFAAPETSVVRSEVTNVNDGRFGTQAWAARVPDDSPQQPWVQFHFSKPVRFDRIRLSSNREDFLETDYLVEINRFAFNGYRVEIEDENGQWKQVASTDVFSKLDQQHQERADLLSELHRLIDLVNEEGPKPSFVGRFTSPMKTFVMSRGSPESLREEVYPAGISVLDGNLGIEPYASGSQRRAAFAKWLTETQNPLTARVAVNRVWHHLFGRGIVTTTSDFGTAGAVPSHPELLDWLAAEFMQPTKTDFPAQAWSIKQLIRLMVMSDAFRQSSLERPDVAGVDAALLWRYPPKRVEAEVIRDSILQASGDLNRQTGGPSYRIHNVKKRYAQWEVLQNHGPETWRRMIYQERMRRVDDEMFTAFDFPDCGQVLALRPTSTTPLQALNLMNSDFVMEQSKRIADRARQEVGNDLGKAVRCCFQLLLGRDPTTAEHSASTELADAHDLSLVCRAIINANEFAFLP